MTTNQRPELGGISIQPLTTALADSFLECLAVIAREKKYLAMVDAPSPGQIHRFVAETEKHAMPHLVAVDEGHVVGWCGLFPSREVGFTHSAKLWIGVHPNHRRKGIATRLLQPTLVAAIDQGLIRIELEVFASNAPAIALFQGAGFAREGVKRRARYFDGVFSEIEYMALLTDGHHSSAV